MLLQFDQELFLILNQNFRNKYFDWLFTFIAKPGLFQILLVCLGLWIFWEGYYRQKVLVILILFAALIGNVLNNIIKEHVGKLRPYWVLEGVRLLVGKSDSSSTPDNYATNVISVTSMITYEYRKKKKIIRVFLTLALLVVYT